MKACFVTDKSVSSFWETDIEKVGKVPLLCFGFNGLGLVSYKKELKGETEYFHDIASLSRQTGGVVVSGLDTDTYGVYRHSCVLADKGKILGVSDANFMLDESEFKSGGNFRVYETSAGKIGVVVAEDVFYPEVIKTLSLCDADFVISVFGRIENSMAQVMMRAGSFSCGVTICMLAENYLQASDSKGNIIFATANGVTVTELNIEKEFHKITTRRRGYSCDGVF
jgi:predicted amidohydrolase